MMSLYFYSLSLIFMTLIVNKYKFILHNFLLLITPLMALNFNLNMFWTKIYYIYGIDLISMNLILLNSWIISLSFLANFKFLFKNFNKNFYLIILSMNLFMMFCFSSINLIMFYIYFESSMIPLILLIMGWGMKIERIQASMYLIFYTLFGSLPLFCLMIWILFKFNNLSFIILSNMSFSQEISNNWVMYMSMYMGFLIKSPMYFIHFWLPKAHVEAPASGSMILAGIMLKVGTYGIYRMIYIFYKLNLYYNYTIVALTLLGSFFSCLMCMKNTDLKSIIAYSSIVHMNMLLASLITMNYWSIFGSIWMMLAHGLCSSGMFFITNIFYERSHTRNIMINKGFLNLFPSLSLMWFLMCSSNFSAPPSLNLFSEIMLITGLMCFLKNNMIMIMIITFLSTYYSIYLFSFSQHSKLFNIFNLKYINILEYLLMNLHWIPLNLMFLMLNLF